MILWLLPMYCTTNTWLRMWVDDVLKPFNKGIKVLVTDSQRFTDLLPDLNQRLGAEPPMQWNETQLDAFTGSGVMVDEDQTYNVTVRVLGIGWESC